MPEGRTSGRPSERPGDRQFVTALARGLDILRCFQAGDPALTNQEIAERTGLPKPTVSRLTHTLRELGYLTFSRRTGAYQLGAGVLALGYAMIAALEIREHVRPYMDELAGMANVTVALGARDRLSVVYLDVRRGAQTISLSRNVGSRQPLATTAIGRAILAALPEPEREYLLRALREREPDTFRQVERGIRRACDELAERGFCASFGDWLPDVNAVGAPLLSVDGEHLYGLNAGGPAFLVPPEILVEQLGPRLARITRELSGPRLGQRDGGGW
ncbi:MAG TPA: IclR family transcriptional regulator [Thermohalobaculum sp.]|nr:IclR family transcriptional regulator [Thermohalobaculum sp.]